MPRPRGTSAQNTELLTAALEGLEAQKHRIEEQIRNVQGMLGRRRGRPPGTASKTAAAAPAAAERPRRKRRRLSPEARKRIAAAQKKRWENYRKAHGEE